MPSFLERLLESNPLDPRDDAEYIAWSRDYNDRTWDGLVDDEPTDADWDAWAGESLAVARMEANLDY